MQTIPQSFVWTKMGGAESAESLDNIIRRKELERRAGGGLFAWGIGNALGSGVTTLAAVEPRPQVLFSPMLSKAKAVDSAPAAVLLWTAYADQAGAIQPLPGHMLITSRGHLEDGSSKARHYALFCRSNVPLSGSSSRGMTVSPHQLRNLATNGSLGASQVTAVVRRTADKVPPPARSAAGAVTSPRSYVVAFRADLAGPMYVRLLAPYVLPAAALAEMDAVAAQGDVAAWRGFVQSVRLDACKSDSEFSLQ